MNEENMGTADTAAPTSHTIYCCQGRVSYPLKVSLYLHNIKKKSNWFGYPFATFSSFHPIYGLDEMP